MWIPREPDVFGQPTSPTAVERLACRERDLADLRPRHARHRVDLNPHPVRADDLDHPDELRVDLDPVPGVPWSQIREVALATREALTDVGLVGWPKTSGSRGIHINVRIERRWTYPEVRRAALALARDVERRVPDAATSKWWKEERHGVFLDYNQNAKDRTVASAYSVRPLPDARVSTPLRWDEVADVEAEAFTIATVPARFATIGDPGAGIDEAVGSLEALLELSRRHEAEGLGDAPWPPNYAKQAGEPPRVQPSRKRRAETEYEPGRGEAGGPPPEVAAERAAAVAAGDPNAGLPTEWAGPTPDPDRPAQDVVPVIEIARATTKAEALEGLERWKARHPAAAAALEPADVLVDGMRGRSSLWYRVRVNLIHVPEADRPPRSRSTPTTTRGPATSGRIAPASSSARRAGPPRRNPDEPDATVARRLRARADRGGLHVVGCVNGTQRGRTVPRRFDQQRRAIAERGSGPSHHIPQAAAGSGRALSRRPDARCRRRAGILDREVALGRVGRRPADRLRQHRRRQDDPLGVSPGGRGGIPARGRRGLALGRAGAGDGRAVLVPEGERPALDRSPGPGRRVPRGVLARTGHPDRGSRRGIPRRHRWHGERRPVRLLPPG